LQSIPYYASVAHKPIAEVLGSGNRTYCAIIILVAMRYYESTEIKGDSIQAVIEVYKKDVDKTLIRQNLKLTVEERLLNLEAFVRFAGDLREAGKRLHSTGNTRK
jgi:hypothetical protein